MTSPSLRQAYSSDGVEPSTNAHSLSEIMQMPSDEFIKLVDAELASIPNRHHAALAQLEAERVRQQSKLENEQ